MIIIPALDLIDGKVVRLQQGDYGKQTVFKTSPLEQFEAYIAQGASYLHLVDLDGAKDPTKRQLATIKRLVETINVPIQVGGGIRTQEDVKRLLDIGVARVVVGSSAIKDPTEVKRWFMALGKDRLVLALDVHIKNQQKLIALHGWTETSTQTLEAVIDSFREVGLTHVLCTDISKDGMLKGANVALYHEITQKYPHINFQASGGIGDLQDIEVLKSTGVFGIIVGRALLENKLTVKEAVQCLQK